MAVLFIVAARNVFRHRRRTIMTAGAVAFGVVFMVVAAGFLSFTFWGLRQSIVYGGLGHLQIVPSGTDTRARLSPEVVDGARALLRDDPAVELVTSRLEFQGLVSAGPGTFTFSGIGVDAIAEQKVRALTTITSGRWFTGSERVPQALLGQGLASRLHVRPRDVITLVTYSDGGSMSAVEVQVAGMFESGVVEYDARTLLVPLTTARDLMDTARPSSVVVVLRDFGSIEQVASRLAERVAPAGHDAHVVRWDELSPIYGSVVRLYAWILNAFLVVLCLVIILGIANTISMAVFERVVEIGTMRALGFPPIRIVVMFLAEATVVGALGAGGGVVLGVLACLGISSVGIDMPPPPGHSQGYVAEVRVVPQAFVAAAAIAIVAAVIAGVGPALRSVRGEVSDVLRPS